ncbi:MAG TPA: hypothetical protein VIG24_12410 [Acidimicrobiia bacterium]
MKLAKYNKAFVAAVGAIALAVSVHVPMEVGTIETVIMAVLTATGVYAIPNAESD